MTLWALCPSIGDFAMSPWKAALGVGAACAACRAVPLLGGAAALTVGTGTLAAAGSALLACADEFAVPGAILLGLAAVGGGLIWCKRRSQRQTPRTSSCEGAWNARSA